MTSMRPGLLLVYWQSFTPERIGMDVDYALYTLDVASGELKKVYSESRIGYGRRFKPSAYRGWAGASPTATDALLVDFVVPPNIPPHMSFIAVDYLTGKFRELGRSDELGISPEATWSPDGSAVAFQIGAVAGRYLSLNTDTGEITQLDAKPPIGPAVGPEAKAKILKLKGLLMDGLIGADEYRARRLKLIEAGGAR